MIGLVSPRTVEEASGYLLPLGCDDLLQEGQEASALTIDWCMGFSKAAVWCQANERGHLIDCCESSFVATGRKCSVAIVRIGSKAATRDRPLLADSRL